MTDIKKLMGDAISEDTASALQTILDTALNESKSEKDKIVNDLINQLNERKNEVDALNDKVNELTESLKTAETEHQEEIDNLNESIDDLKTSHDIEISSLEESIDYIKVKADEYSELVKQELTDTLTEKAVIYADAKTDQALDELRKELTEQAERYGEFLQEQAEIYAEKSVEQVRKELTEKAERYGEFLQEQAEIYAEKSVEQAIEETKATLIEQAELYGEFLIEKAEEHAVYLIEQADLYAKEQVMLTEERCLEESNRLINEFKEQYKDEFDRVDEHNRMAMVFKNLKTLIESSGFSIDEHSQFDEVEQQLREAKSKARRLERELHENEAELKRLKIFEAVQTIDENLTFKDKEVIMNNAIKTRFKNDSELKSVVKTLVENIKLNKNNNNIKNDNLDINQDTSLNENKKTSGWAGKLL